MVTNLPSNAVGRGLIPGLGTKIPHAAGQLRPGATTTQPEHSRALALQPEMPRATQLEKDCPTQQRTSAAKKKKRGPTLLTLSSPGHLNRPNL